MAMRVFIFLCPKVTPSHLILNEQFFESTAALSVRGAKTLAVGCTCVDECKNNESLGKSCVQVTGRMNLRNKVDSSVESSRKGECGRDTLEKRKLLLSKGECIEGGVRITQDTF